MTVVASGGQLLDRLHGTWRILLKELASFGIVGLFGFVTDMVIFNLLIDDGEIKAKIAATTIATTVTYFGNKYFSFSHRARSSLGQEAGFFVGINVAVLAGSAVVLAIFSYPLGFGGDRLVMNVVNLATIGIGTVIRFWGYKRFVFLHPDRVHTHVEELDLDEELAE